MANLTWQQWAQKMAQRPGRVRAAMQAATTEVVNVTHAASKRLMTQLIYDIPEDRTGWSYGKKGKSGKAPRKTTVRFPNPTGAGTKTGQRKVSGKSGAEHWTPKHTGEAALGGKKKWTRTGNLRRSEQKQVVSPTVGRLWNDAGYALPRHNLGLSPGDPEAAPPPPSRQRNTKRIAPWRTRAVWRTAVTRRGIYRKHLLNALR